MNASSHGGSRRYEAEESVLMIWNEAIAVVQWQETHLTNDQLVISLISFKLVHSMLPPILALGRGIFTKHGLCHSWDVLDTVFEYLNGHVSIMCFVLNILYYCLNTTQIFIQSNYTWQQEVHSWHAWYPWYWAHICPTILSCLIFACSLPASLGIPSNNSLVHASGSGLNKSSMSLIFCGSWFWMKLCTAARATGNLACKHILTSGGQTRIQNCCFRTPNILLITLWAIVCWRLRSSCTLTGLITRR